jgi:hypothetical protein
MDKPDQIEPGTHVFTGTVKRWDVHYGELLTDSGVAVYIDTHGQPPVYVGAHVTVVARKYRPCYLVMGVRESRTVQHDVAPMRESLIRR